jgi:hypothetical protein
VLPGYIDTHVHIRRHFDPDGKEPHQYSEGTAPVVVNGKLAFENGRPTGALSGRPLPRRSK